jgi:hypothetical protein
LLGYGVAMSGAFFLTLIFGGTVVGIWLSYRAFMRGDTNEERVASRLPAGFKPEWSYRCGDTYVGYETANDRLVIVDYPRNAVMKARDLVSIESWDQSMLGIVHRWVLVNAPQSPKLKIWFRLSAGRRDEMLAKLKGLGPAR